MDEGNILVKFKNTKYKEKILERSFQRDIQREKGDCQGTIDL